MLYRHFDLYSAFARIDTDNSLPNSEFHNATYAGNFGWTPNSKNDVRFTVRHIVVSGGQPNAIALYGIPDAAQEKDQDNYYGVVWNNQTTNRWHNQLRYGGLRQNSEFNDFGATGIFDGNTGYYNGAPSPLTAQTATPSMARQSSSTVTSLLNTFRQPIETWLMRRPTTP